MKFSLLAAAFVSTASAVPSLLAARQHMCWTNSIDDATTATSPLVTDCQALAGSNLPEDQPWTPSEANSFSFDVRNGTCGFKGVFNPDGGSLPASEVTVTSTQVSIALEHAIEQFAVDGRVGANGFFACMIPGQIVKVGWTKFEIYTVE